MTRAEALTRLDKLRELAAKATPGPWGRDGSEWSNGIRSLSGNQPIIAFWDNRLTEREDDIAFIAALPPGVVLALCDVAEAAGALSAETEEDEAMDGECRGRCDSYALSADELHVDGCPIPSLRDALARLSAATGAATPKGADRE